MDSQRKDLRFEKQGRVNSLNPTRSGVISSPDPRQQTDIQRVPSPDITLRNQVPKANNARANAEESGDGELNSSVSDAAGSEDFVTEESERHHKVNDDTGVNIHRR